MILDAKYLLLLIVLFVFTAVLSQHIFHLLFGWVCSSVLLPLAHLGE